MRKYGGKNVMTNRFTRRSVNIDDENFVRCKKLAAAMAGSVSGVTGEMKTVFGWRRRIGREPNPRSLMNFPMQANGAEMMRIAAIAGTEAGIEVCAPVHDAFLIAAD